ncbi:ABC transporter [Nibricoccus aquaticus]|uniref:ABC transporter n=1 Tax=Nibricoccus aquaticus TaxID=2576891 RepID=A0A290Q942_9BACT|nr:ABC transporter ATP-binding protein [Nibricoccus aquaticus]ATC64963.1 ABC transporter [Nibricoccus aquaticus]
MNAIETHSLSRRYGRTEAVHDLTLTIPTGSIFALLGPNGAGKTTTIKVLMNLLAPTSGEARILGTDSRRLRESDRARIGYVSENQQLPLWMTVRQLLDYCRPFYPTWDRDLEKKLLNKFSLPPDRKLKHLSRGMLMKASLLSSLAYRPKLLVLDEPFSGLDPLVRDEFIHGVLETSAAGEWTVLISSHDIAEIEQLADHVAILDAGRLKLSEPTESLQARFRRIELTLHSVPESANVPVGLPPPGAPASGRLPSSASPTRDLSISAASHEFPQTWLAFERTGTLARFIETRFDPAATESACRTHFPDAQVTAHPMTLREIFVVLARASRPAATAA